MTETDALHNELHAARQAQADAEFARELAGQIVAQVAEAVQALPVDRLRILAAYVTKSIELAGGSQE